MIAWPPLLSLVKGKVAMGWPPFYVKGMGEPFRHLQGFPCNVDGIVTAPFSPFLSKGDGVAL